MSEGTKKKRYTLLINLDSEYYDLFEKENNKSALISSLLTNYFSSRMNGNEIYTSVLTGKQDEDYVIFKVDDKIKEQYKNDIYKSIRPQMLLTEFYSNVSPNSYSVNKNKDSCQKIEYIQEVNNTEIEKENIFVEEVNNTEVEKENIPVEEVNNTEVEKESIPVEENEEVDSESINSQHNNIQQRQYDNTPVEKANSENQEKQKAKVINEGGLGAIMNMTRRVL